VTHYGPHEPFSGAAVAVGDLFYDTFKGMGEICYEFLGAPHASSFKVWKKTQADALKRLQSSAHETIIAPEGESSKGASIGPAFGISGPSRFSDSSSGYTPGKHALTGTLRIGKAAARAPGAFTLAMARGAHNVPKLWGDRTVRPQEKVTGISSGVKEGVKELAFGVFDGISGLFVQPVLGFVESGPLGFVKGVGKGALGLPVKFCAAASGIVGYPLKGLDVSITNAMKGPHSGLKAVRHARILQGEVEYQDASAEKRRGVVNWWGTLVLGADE
jgi:hypothetical protein